MKIVGIVVLIALTFLVPVRSYSEQDLLLRLKNVYGYDAWAGKTGAMKQEPALDSLVLPGNVFIGNTPNPEGITYVWGEAPDKPQISATVKTYSSIEEAQIGLINILGRFSTILPKAEAQGLKIGDAGFMLNESNTTTFIAFVKNNCTVVVKNVGSGNPKPVDNLAVLVESSI